jgi:hypothetical protein
MSNVTVKYYTFHVYTLYLQQEKLKLNDSSVATTSVNSLVALALLSLSSDFHLITKSVNLHIYHEWSFFCILVNEIWNDHY